MESHDGIQMSPGQPESGARSQAALERVIETAASVRRTGDGRLLAAAAR